MLSYISRGGRDEEEGAGWMMRMMFCCDALRPYTSNALLVDARYEGGQEEGTQNSFMR
jgi:hypothetical protein